MNIISSRRNFLRGVAGLSLAGAAGCKCPLCGPQKIKLAAVGVMGKGFSDWVPMLKSGLVEIVAFCDCDYSKRQQAQERLIATGVDFDMYKVPFYTDYRRLLDDAGVLGIEAMTVSTTDHTHAPIAVRAMQQGIHVYVQKPLVRTLWELKRFNDTANEYGVITQMGNQGSALPGLRRATDVLNSGILGDVREVHVWTNRPVWPQGRAAGQITTGKADKVPAGFNWNCWLATAKDRPFKLDIPKDVKVYNPWKICNTVYHPFNWRGFFDFGCGAFGDMACHTMNVPFRGLELGAVERAELQLIEDKDPLNIAFPMKTVVKMTYAARDSKARPGVRLPAVDLYWYDGNEKPSPDLMPQVIAAGIGKRKGKVRAGDEKNPDNGVPNTGCLIIGSKGVLCSTNDYGGKSFVALKGEAKVVDMLEHPACKAVAQSIPLRGDATERVEKGGGGAGAAAVSADGHYIEFLDAIRGVGPVYEQTHSRCFSDVEYSIPQMEGILVGVTAQRVGGVLAWNSAAQTFDRKDANDLIRPYIRKGFEF